MRDGGKGKLPANHAKSRENWDEGGERRGDAGMRVTSECRGGYSGRDRSISHEICRIRMATRGELGVCAGKYPKSEAQV